MTEQDKVAVLEDNHRLRLENDLLRAECDEAQEIAKKYEDRYFNTLVERDEARREICENSMYQWQNPQLTSICRGWDCYREESK